MAARTSRSRAVRCCALLLVVPLWAGCTGGDAAGPRLLPLASAAPDDQALIPAYDEHAPLPSPAGLAGALAGPLADRRLGDRVGLRVVDVATGQVLLDRRGEIAVTPASTVKLATGVAALRALGPDHRLVTAVRRAAGGAVPRLVLVGGGDPTLAGPRSIRRYPAPASLQALAERTAAALSPGAAVTLAVDDGLFTGPRTAAGWKPNYVPDGDVAPVSALEVDGARLRPDDDPHTPDPRAADPALHAGAVFASLLTARGIRVTGKVRRARAAGSELARVESPPLAALVEGMLARSDNDLAEALGRHVALATGGPATFAGAAAAIEAALAALGVGESVLADASGLSTANRISPAALVAIVRAAAGPEHPELRPVITGLPVAGFSGTLTQRFASAAPGLGAVRAKTGTLTGVSTLAGIVVDADGRLLAFAATAPAAAATKPAQAALDRLLAALAGCGCR